MQPEFSQFYKILCSHRFFFMHLIKRKKKKLVWWASCNRSNAVSVKYQAPVYFLVNFFLKSVSETSIFVKGRTTILKTLHLMLHTMQSKKWISNIISHAEISQMYFQWKIYPQTSNIYDEKKYIQTNVCKSTHMVQLYSGGNYVFTLVMVNSQLKKALNPICSVYPCK